MHANKEKNKSIIVNVSNSGLNPTTITNQYFSGQRKRNTFYDELSINGKEFILLLISYELNFEAKKIDYYFRLAKKLQLSFHIPGWLLHLPDPTVYVKKNVRNKIIRLAIIFKNELETEQASISSNQAFFLNNAYKNFIWE